MSGNPPGQQFACLSCGTAGALRVVDSRLSQKLNAIRRRRVCIHCKARFTTYETLSEDNPIVRRRDTSAEIAAHLDAALTLLRAGTEYELSGSAVTPSVSAALKETNKSPLSRSGKAPA